MLAEHRAEYRECLVHFPLLPRSCACLRTSYPTARGPSPRYIFIAVPEQAPDSGRIEQHSSFGGLADEWSELANRTAAAPFLHAGWFEAWWEAFGDGELCILAFRRGNRLAGVLPLVRRKGMLFSPTNWFSQMYGPVAEDESAARALFAGALAEEPRRLQLSFLPEDGSLDDLRAVANGYRLSTRNLADALYVGTDGDWDSYLADRSRNLRHGVERPRRRLQEQGELPPELIDGSEDLAAQLDRGWELEASGWKAQQGTAIMSSPEARRFFTRLSEWAARSGCLLLAFLCLDGRAIAFTYSFEAGGRTYALKSGIDENLAHLGPGSVLTAEMIERAFKLGLQSYEFLKGRHAYKLRWATGERHWMEAQAFAPTPRGAVDRLLQTRAKALARRAWHRLHRNPDEGAPGQPLARRPSGD
jgi:CelD/BcsL family acetyltransferase involved in cellulose biosynthesis